MNEKSKLAQLASKKELTQLGAVATLLANRGSSIAFTPDEAVEEIRRIDREFDLVRKSDHLNGGLAELLAEIEKEGSWKGMQRQLKEADKEFVLVPREEYEEGEKKFAWYQKQVLWCDKCEKHNDIFQLKQDLAASRADSDGWFTAHQRASGKLEKAEKDLKEARADVERLDGLYANAQRERVIHREGMARLVKEVERLKERNSGATED